MNVKNKNSYSIFKLLLLISGSSLSVAYYAQFYLNLEPCILCVYQRIPYFLIALLSVYIIIFKKYPLQITILVLLLQFSEVILSLYHVGLEKHIFKTDYLCRHNDNLNYLSDEEILKDIMSKTTASCDIPVYIMPQLSMAEMNAIFSSLVFTTLLILLRKKYEFTRR